MPHLYALIQLSIIVILPDVNEIVERKSVLGISVSVNSDVFALLIFFSFIQCLGKCFAVRTGILLIRLVFLCIRVYALDAGDHRNRLNLIKTFISVYCNNPSLDLFRLVTKSAIISRCHYIYIIMYRQKNNKSL